MPCEAGPWITAAELEGGWIWGVLFGHYRFAHRFRRQGDLLICRCGRLHPRPLRRDSAPPLQHVDAIPRCSSCEVFP